MAEVDVSLCAALVQQSEALNNDVPNKKALVAEARSMLARAVRSRRPEELSEANQVCESQQDLVRTVAKYQRTVEEIQGKTGTRAIVVVPPLASLEATAAAERAEERSRLAAAAAERLYAASEASLLANAQTEQVVAETEAELAKRLEGEERSDVGRKILLALLVIGVGAAIGALIGYVYKKSRKQ